MLGNGMTWEVIPAPRGRLYEGPTWIKKEEAFQWVDILDASVHRWSPYDDEPVESRSLELEFATLALPLDSDRSLVASRSSLHEYSWSSGRLVTLGEWTFEEDIRFNDGGLSPAGELFIGTMSMEGRPGAGALFHFSGHELAPVIGGVGISNGLVWTDSDRGWYVDSLARTIYWFQTRGKAWHLTPIAVLEDGEEPDGLAVLPDGQVACAVWGAGRLDFLSEDGFLAGSASVPCRFPTALATGGEFIFVTSANPESNAETMDGSVFLSKIACPDAMRDIV